MPHMITPENLNNIKNPGFRNYVKRYLDIEEQTDGAIESLGIPFNRSNQKTAIESVVRRGAAPRNGNKSFYLNWLSPACLACQTGEKSHTSFISFKCHKSCYFCFNNNQENYAEFRVKDNDPVHELRKLLARGEVVDYIALTGGEPLLHPDKAVAFFDFIKKRTPNTHTRLYTAGDLLTDQLLADFQSAGLNEIRFSIKQDESTEVIEKLFEKMSLSKAYIPQVVVEMPVIPGTLSKMKWILLELERIGIAGINLLEFCFPIQNPNPFKERGFELKYPPFQTYYNYWYAGGLAIDQSEEECFELLAFAAEKELAIGVHYCSLENKHTGQLYQQNKAAELEGVYTFSETDYFIKSAKVFGEERHLAESWFVNRGLEAFEHNDEHDYLMFPVAFADDMRRLGLEVAICSSVAEEREGEGILREVKVELAL
ncbi:radical SAM protein [Salipaludibacillus sp. CUR1]|uniref:radical SAM protein n=1 Tax=Salipaludibacillus sp. CUR1 TaxID=2820003 RepID=UPI001E5EBEC1|nr:radical SAM protein [Salipaludibacillus sp. CUR1]MCE7791794.1 radical SAM protein [Salipaludibacillus sp. CUR1]